METHAFRPPRIHTREEWHAAAGKAAKLDKPQRIVLHHSWRPTATAWRGGDTVRSIQTYHMRSNGWADIAYHYLIGPDGTIWAGRDPETLGAHSGGKLPGGAVRQFGNTGSLGICCIGDYDTETPSQELIVSTTALIVYLQEHYRLEQTALYGHCEAQHPAPKTCPGRLLFEVFFGPARWRANFPKA